MKKNIKLKDVAIKAGVGVGTASRVLNNHPNVSDKTKEKVLQAMDELGYQVNEIARSLKTKSSKTIAIVLCDVLNPYYMRIVKGVEKVAGEKGYSIILVDLDWDMTGLVDRFTMLQNKNVDGVIYMGSWVSKEDLIAFSKINIPIALVSSTTVKYIDEYKKQMCSVNIDNKKAAYDAIKFLYDLDYRKIGCIGGVKGELNTTKPRENGVKLAFKELGLRKQDQWFINGNYEFEGGYKAMEKFLNGKNTPEAVFCFNDEMAMGAIKAVFDSGKSVPKDMAVIGFDDIESSRFYNPGLTTIRQPRFSMGSIGATLLIDLIEGRDIKEPNIIIEHKFVERETH